MPPFLSAQSQTGSVVVCGGLPASTQCFDCLAESECCKLGYPQSPVFKQVLAPSRKDRKLFLPFPCCSVFVVFVLQAVQLYVGTARNSGKNGTTTVQTIIDDNLQNILYI